MSQKEKTVKDFVEEHNITINSYPFYQDESITKWKLIFRMCPMQEKCRQAVFHVERPSFYQPNIVDELFSLQENTLNTIELGFSEYRETCKGDIQGDRHSFDIMQEEAYKLKKFLGKERYNELLTIYFDK